METLTDLNKKEIIFGIYDVNSKDAKATIENGKCVAIKLLIKAPRRFYNSFVNDAEKAFVEQYPDLY
jgi:hypothetical protein